MNHDDIIRMAREARLAEPYHPFNPWSASQEALERFAALVAAAERESCALLCESQDETDTRYRYDYRRGVLDCADAIRSRSNT